MAPLRTRSGTTLTEVLMSLMIMSIGIVLVATLFPVSTMRALEANRATNSTIARHVADALTDVDPQFIHNPDGKFPDPNPLNLLAPDATLYNTAFLGTIYLVDPLGWQSLNQDNPQPPLPLVSPRDFFGNNPPSSVTVTPPRRFTGASMIPYFLPAPATNPVRITPYPTTAGTPELANAVARAGQIVTQPDNWKLVTEAQGTATGSSILSLTLDSDGDLSSIDPTIFTSPYPSSVYRAVIFSVDGSQSEVRTLSGISPPGVGWGADAPLPTRFEGGNIGKVRIEVSDEIYTWMLSVRKRVNGSTNVDVVVFFKRAITDQQEQLYATPFQPNTDNKVTVTFTSEPTLKRGGYIFDAANGLWYRIAKIENETGYSADLLLDETIKQRNYVDSNSNGIWDAGEPLGGAILHPQVVNVFPLQSKEP